MKHYIEILFLMLATIYLVGRYWVPAAWWEHAKHTAVRGTHVTYALRPKLLDREMSYQRHKPVRIRPGTQVERSNHGEEKTPRY